MPKNLNVFAGPGQITLYDATNGYLFLGFSPDIRVQEKSLTHTNINGQLIRYDRRYTLRATLPVTDYTTLDDLEDRDGTAQDIHVAGLDNYFTVSSVNVVYEIERNWSGSKIHSFEITATWKDVTDHSFAVNLLTLNDDIEYKMEAATGGVADGWTLDNENSSSVDGSSFRSGNKQNIAWIGDPDQDFYTDNVSVCFDQPVKLTASIYLLLVSGAGDAQIGFGYVYEDDTTGTDYTTYANASLSGSGARIHHTASFSPTQGVKSLNLRLKIPDGDTISVQLDDAQLELGNLSTFRED